jgi:hypothetical protein
MSGLDSKTVDEVSLKLSGLIGIFDLIVTLSSKAAINSQYKDETTMNDFAYFVSQELQGVFKKITGCDYFKLTAP